MEKDNVVPFTLQGVESKFFYSLEGLEFMKKRKRHPFLDKLSGSRQWKVYPG